MTAVRKLEIRINQTGDAASGIAGISGSVGKIAKVGLVAGAAAVTGVALLTTGVVAAGSKLVGLGSDAEEMQGKFDVVFGKGAPSAAKKLDEFGDAVGRNKFDLMGLASSTQDLLVPMGFARDEASGMSVDMTKLAVDVGSFNNVLEADVQRDFNSAMTGSHETVKKYGVIINQTTLDQELLNMGVEGGVKDATEMEKVQARLNLIYAGTSDAQGDAAKTSGSWANQMRMLKSEVAEAATTMGAELLPALTPLLAGFVEWAKSVLPLVIEKFTYFAREILPMVISKIGALWAWIRDKLIPVFVEFYENSIKPAIQAVRDWAKEFSENAQPVIEKIATFITETLVPAIFNFYENTVKPAIQVIKDWIAEFQERLEPVMERIRALVVEKFMPAIDRLKESWDRIVAVFQSATKKGDETGQKFDAIGFILAAFEGTVWLVVASIEAISYVVETAVSWMEKLRDIIRKVVEKWEDLKEAAKNFKLPSFLTPGSPTPLELGLRGIADAASRVNLEMGGMGFSPAMTGAGGGGGGITVNLTYSPAVGLANRAEAQEKLGPYIAEYLRKEGY